MFVVLLGPPGSGKGTQGQILAKHLKISHISTGDLFRAILADPGHPLYPKVQVVKEGKLVSDDVVNQVVENGLHKPEYAAGILFDGYPRTVAQAEALDGMLSDMNRKVDLVIDFDVTREVLLYRLLGRRVCPKCKRIFHVRQGISTCPDCNAALIQRDDDNEETILERFREYKEKTAPLQEYYRSGKAAYIALTINDASKSPQDVQNEIIGLLEQNGFR
jgi:adenylate kinase